MWATTWRELFTQGGVERWHRSIRTIEYVHISVDNSLRDVYIPHMKEKSVQAIWARHRKTLGLLKSGAEDQAIVSATGLRADMLEGIKKTKLTRQILGAAEGEHNASSTTSSSSSAHPQNGAA